MACCLDHLVRMEMEWVGMTCEFRDLDEHWGDPAAFSASRRVPLSFGCAAAPAASISGSSLEDATGLAALEPAPIAAQVPAKARALCLLEQGCITAAEGQVLLNHEERALQLEQEALQARASFYAAATQQASPAAALPGATLLAQGTSSVLEMPLQSNDAADSCSRNACRVDVSFASDHANTSEADEKHHEVHKTASESSDSSAEDFGNTVTDSGLTARKCLDCWNPMPPLCATCIKAMKHKQIEGRAKWRSATEIIVDKRKLFMQMSRDAMKPNRNTKERCFHSLSSLWTDMDTGAWNDEEPPSMKY